MESTTTISTLDGVSGFRETLKDVISSAIGSTCCVYTGQPFDTIKVRMQVMTHEAGRVNIFSTLRSTVQQGGVTALWRGSTPALTGQLLENGVAFAINGFLKRLFPEEQTSLERQEQADKSFVKLFILGGVTGFCTSFVLCPCDTVKCRAQANILAGKASDVSAIIRGIVHNHGTMGLWRGMPVQVMRDVPFYASFFGSYDILCYALRRMTSWSDHTIFFISGGLAGQIGWMCSIVPDTIKSRIQVSDDSSLTVRGVFRDIIRTRGVRGLLTGVQVAIIRAFPANAALFLGYEKTRHLLSSQLP